MAIDADSRLVFMLRLGISALNEELRGKEDSKECQLCDNKCEDEC